MDIGAATYPAYVEATLTDPRQRDTIGRIIAIVES